MMERQILKDVEGLGDLVGAGLGGMARGDCSRLGLGFDNYFL